MQRLGKNVGRYLGDTIDIQTVLREIEIAARDRGWTSEIFHETQDLKLFALTRPAKILKTNIPKSLLAAELSNSPAAIATSPSPPRSGGEVVFNDVQDDPSRDGSPAPLSTLNSQPSTSPTPPTPRIYISAGIHGDEPAGPLAALRLLQEDMWPENVDLWFCPCLNPLGFARNSRENTKGIDLNRDYLKPTTDEIAAHITWLERQPKFDLCLLLHEDWESYGFYLYEQNPDGRRSLAEPMIEAVSKVCPIDPNELIEGRPAQNGIIRPNLDPNSRPQWPEAFYLITHKTRQSYTLEAPSDYPLTTRVDALVAAVKTSVEIISRQSTAPNRVGRDSSPSART